MAGRISDYFETVSREDYCAEAATRLARSSFAAPPRPKRPVGHPRKTATTNQLENFGHSSTNRQRQQPVSESEQENSTWR